MNSSSSTRRNSRQSEVDNEGEDSENKLKNSLFLQSSLHLSDSETISPTIFYCIEFLECLYFLWFIIHPALNIYSQDSFLVKETQTGNICVT